MKIDLNRAKRALTPFMPSQEQPDQQLGRGVTPVAKRGILSHKAVRPTVIAIGVLAIIGFVASSVHDFQNDHSNESKPVSTGSDQIAATQPPPPTLSTQASDRAPQPNADKAPESRPPPAAAPTDFVRFPSSSGELSFAPASTPAKAESVPGKVMASSGVNKGDDGGTNNVYKASVIEGGEASPGEDLTYIMLPQNIPIRITGAMQSQFAGDISGITTADVTSPGNVLLLHSGSIFTGVYKNDVGGAQNRLFSLAGTITDPKTGISVPLDNSSITDGYGITGVQGQVDQHIGLKFGGALLITGIDIAASLAQTAMSKQGQTNLNISSGGEAGGLATDLLRQQQNIQNTITVAPGQMATIFVNHKISFRHSVRVTVQ